MNDLLTIVFMKTLASSGPINIKHRNCLLKKISKKGAQHWQQMLPVKKKVKTSLIPLQFHHATLECNIQRFGT